MRRSAPLSAVFALTLCATLAGQQPTFRAGVSLVTVDVTVLDKDGQPVPGLSADDFEIKLNGKPQPVRALAFLEATSPAVAPPPAPNASGGRIIEAPKPAGFATPRELDVRRTINNQDDAPARPTSAIPPPANPPPANPAPEHPGTRAPAHQNEQRTFVILIDDLSFTAQRGKKLFAAAQRFVDSVPSSDALGFTTTSGSATVNPTMDRNAVKAGLSKVVGEFFDPRYLRKGDAAKGEVEQPIGFDEALDIDRGDERLLVTVIARECFGGDPKYSTSTLATLLQSGGPCPGDVVSEVKRTAALVRLTRSRQVAAITSVINSMRVASGIRHLVVVTDGVAISRDVNELQALIPAAGSAGIQFSVVMEDPDLISMETTGRSKPNFDGDPGGSKRICEDNRLMLNGAQTLTDMVGGIFYYVVGDAGPSFERILKASSAVYRLGVELPAGTPPGKALLLGVNIKRPGLTVRANKMAVNSAAAHTNPPPANPPPPNPPPANPAPEHPSTSAPANPAPIDDVLKAALNQNQDLRGVPIRLGAAIRRSTASAGQIDVSVNALMPSSAKTPITALVGVVDENGALRVSRRVIDSTIDAVQFLLPLAPGNYAIRFAAADADRALGTIELPLAVKLHTLGAFTSSDVMTWVLDQKATLFSTDQVPAAGKLHASVELYPAGPMPADAPVIRWTVAREGETNPVVDEEADAQPGQSLFRSDVEIPFESLAPGTYIIRATLLVADKPAGSVGATIRKQ